MSVPQGIGGYSHIFCQECGFYTNTGIFFKNKREDTSLSKVSSLLIQGDQFSSIASKLSLARKISEMHQIPARATIV